MKSSNRDKYQVIKEGLESLPCGQTVLLPPIKMIWRAICSGRGAALRFQKRYIQGPLIRKEAIKIVQACEQPVAKKVIIPFDCSVSALGYGEVFYSAMLARYMNLQGKEVHFVFIIDKIRKDFVPFLSEKEVPELISQFAEIPRILLDENSSSVLFMSSEQFRFFLFNNKQNRNPAFVPFIEFVERGEAIYYYVFNLINQLCDVMSQDPQEMFVLTFEELSPKVNVKCPTYPYITWHCRYSQKWSTDRNLKEEEFLKIYSRLKTIFPDHSIMIISDQVGCAHFKQLAYKWNLKCLFSKDYSETFMGDGALILGSDFYFQLRGGGIGCVPMFSSIPYEIICSIGNESKWGKKSITSWAHDRQLFRIATSGLPSGV